MAAGSPKVQLIRGDCLEALPAIATEGIDLVLADLPYGITGCSWDRKISLEPLWQQYLRVTGERGVIALFAQQPFATELAALYLHLLRYEWIWDKGRTTGFANAKKMPLRRHENVLVFYRKQPKYNPQGLRRCRPRTRMPSQGSQVYDDLGKGKYVQKVTGYPQSIVTFKSDLGSVACQKPVGLLEYLIRTYTDEGDTVLDNAMGTGSTGVAAVQTGRNFIGIEIDPERYKIAERRISEARRAAER